MFLKSLSGGNPALTTVHESIYRHHNVRKTLIIGSGGLSIGQAGEFDYSGSQAIKAIKEEGIEVVLVNPNIATVQTSKGMADHTYFLPITPEFVLDVIKKERPDSVIVSMGGQTALNVGVELHEKGELDKYGVRVLGTQIPVIVATEDRDLFAKKLAEINEHAARSIACSTADEAIAAAEKIGYPVLIRAAFALGGLGSGFASNPEELRHMACKAFAASNQILVDEDLRGWKEVEYEVVRDCKDNCITVCNMENFDPLGVHTGDSIVVAPSQTLSNSEYFKLRETSLKVVRHLGVVGECNIQFALHPESERYCIIEVNARLSRSSALASKATGYPLAYVAAKLALGKDLVSIRNSVTRTTTACFEPALDYVVVKIPRWDLSKFDKVSNSLGSSMKSVGEVMAIGRKFEEAIQKAIRMVDPSLNGFEPKGCEDLTGSSLDDALKNPTCRRLFAVARAFEHGYGIDRIWELTRIDRWFLSKLNNIQTMKSRLRELKRLNLISSYAMQTLKCAGFSDLQIGSELGGVQEMAVRRLRVNNFHITPVTKQIDTLAAEFPAQTNYLYMTYNGSEDDISFDGDGIMVLGCGPYCIGSSVEFDWCAVSCVRTLRKWGRKAIVVNYNPETVSTDYDESDRLYFEELSFERVLDIYERERALGMIVSVGGQIPNCLAMPLHRQGVRILGTSPESIDTAEDRNKFSALLDSLGVDQPPWRQLVTPDDAKSFALSVGYPVLVRPSYVLSGAAMNVATNASQLESFMGAAEDISVEHPVVISKFISGAKEIEFDAVADDGNIVNYAISEHIENAGVHSGDATLVLPAQKLYVETIRRIKRIAASLAHALRISGPFNMQFMARENDVKVIELNMRASRTFPFISKTFDMNFISLATKVMVGIAVKPRNIKLLDLDYVAVKAPMFSFTRLAGADPTLGVEMSSTGEVACFGTDMHEAFLKAIMATGFKLPSGKVKSVLLAIGPTKQKASFTESVKILHRLGFIIYATVGSADFFNENCDFYPQGADERGSRKLAPVISLQKPSSKRGNDPNVLDYISSRKIDFVVTVPSTSQGAITDGYRIRRAAVDFGVSLITNLKSAITLVQALAKQSEAAKAVKLSSNNRNGFSISSMGDFYAGNNSVSLFTGTGTS